MGPKQGPDGKLAITLPMGDKKLPASRPRTSAGAPTGSSSGATELIGKTVGIAGEHLTGAEMAARSAGARAARSSTTPCRPRCTASFGFPGADDLGNMFQYKRDFETSTAAARDLAFSRALNPELQTFEQWLLRYGAEIPIAA